AGPQQYIQKAPQRKLNGNIGELKWEQAQPQNFADEAGISLVEEALDIGILRVQSVAEQVCHFLSISSFLEGRPAGQAIANQPPQRGAGIFAEGRIDDGENQPAGFKNAGDLEGNAQVAIADGCDEMGEQRLQLVAIQIVKQPSREHDARIIRGSSNGCGIRARRVNQHQPGCRQSGGNCHLLCGVGKLQLFQVCLVRLARVHAGQCSAYASVTEQQQHAGPQREGQRHSRSQNQQQPQSNFLRIKRTALLEDKVGDSCAEFCQVVCCLPELRRKRRDEAVE